MKLFVLGILYLLHFATCLGQPVARGFNYMGKQVSPNKSKYLYPIEIADKWGYIDSSGKIVVQPEYNYSTDFVNGLGLVYIPREDPREDEFVAYFNVDGKLICSGVNPANGRKYLHNISEGLLAICDSVTHKFGFVNERGNWVIKPQFYKVSDFSDGLAAVWENADFHVDTGSGCGTPVSHAKWGFIDKSGKYVIEPQYHGVSSFYSGYAYADNSIISKTGDTVNIEGIKNVAVLYQRFNHVYRFMYKDENIWIPNNDENFLNGYIFFRNEKTKTAGFKKWDGSIAIPDTFLGGHFFSEDVAAVEVKKDKWGYIDATGKIIIKPEYEFVLSFSEGLAAVKSKGKWGFIDKLGHFVVPPLYDEVEDFNVMSRFAGGLTRMVYNKKMCYIDRSGKIIWKAP